MPPLRIEPATEGDVPIILSLVKALAEYERLAEMVVATEESVRTTEATETFTSGHLVIGLFGHSIEPLNNQ